ncbi:MAG TPA: glycoside hydrolase family 3 N-terminal domain-containing protein [Micromonosporaceae bacterium]|nr:glycoside hydrolase family 3 N-terminal domain-containing protein [Micromonosporaceae bacterium]
MVPSSRPAPTSRNTAATTLRTLALRTLLPGFGGLEPPAWALRLVREGLGGFALFGYNIADSGQVARLTEALRDARPDAVIAIDEEGGDVTRLCYASGSPYPGNAALGIVDDPDLTRRIYRQIGADVAAVGVTLNMAPTVDVNSVDENPAIGTRSFGADPQRVAAHAAAAVSGLQGAGVAACAKHFPGHGATTQDSHVDLPVVDASEELLWRRELPPFIAAISAGAKAVMTAHIRVPALTGVLPATFSPDALIRLLRKELGFGGAIVSDGLEMRAASGDIGIPEAAVRALIAGNDLLCFGGEIGKGGDAEAVIEATAAAIVAAVQAGRLSAERLEEAAARASLLGGPVHAGRTGGPAEADSELPLAVARAAVRLEGSLPSSIGLLVRLDTPPSVAVGEVPWGLTPFLSGVECLAVDRPYDPAALLARAGDGAIVVFGRDIHRHAWARSLVEELCRRRPGVVLVEMGWPGRWRPAGATAYIASFGASRANSRAVADLLTAAAAGRD